MTLCMHCFPPSTQSPGLIKHEQNNMLKVMLHLIQSNYLKVRKAVEMVLVYYTGGHKDKWT